MTGDLYNLTLLVKLRVLLRLGLINLAITAIAKVTLLRISAEQLPSLHGIAHRYLKLVTSCNFWLFVLVSGTDDVRAVGHDLALFLC